MFDIEEELKQIPGKPGVYLMFDKNDTIIYIGKAINLRNRVRQYFHGGDGRAMLAMMVPQIDHFEYTVTDSELEALILENNLIKEHVPKYNTLLKDDKTYPYIKVTVTERYPRILFTRKVKKDGAKYFGPYTDAGAVRETIDLLQKLYQLRTCRKNLSNVSAEHPDPQRACLNYHMGYCTAPCQGLVSPEQYEEGVNAALRFLGGDHGPVLQELTDKMMDASSKMEFEEAGRYKQLRDAVAQLAQKQKMNDARGEDQDIIAVAVSGKDAIVQAFFVRDGRLIGREHFYMQVRSENSEEEILDRFLKQYYSGTPYLPKDIFLQTELTDQQLISDWLSERKGSKVSILVPKRGQKQKLVTLAKQNAVLILSRESEKVKREEQRTSGAANELGNMIGIGHIQRVEAYDISNISGFNMVGSMVVFESGKPKKSDYRKFRIKSLNGQNDYAAMEEVLTRRFMHGLKEHDSFSRFPDLILMDGGRGQVNIALKVLDQLGLSIPVCGMVKDDHHRTRGLYVDNKEIPIDKTSAAFHLITRVQDEAHRFAITYHRSLRSKGQVHSMLDDIPGIGPARRKALMRSFSSIDAIREATVEELAQVDSMNHKSAQELYDFLRR